MRVLVTGGSGYIGAHAVDLLLARGDEVVVADDLVDGNPARIPDVPIVQLDLADPASGDRIETTLRAHRVEAVIHFAAHKQVAESVEHPAWYFQQNIGGLADLLLGMEAAGVAKLVFSSTAAVYGSANGAIDETFETVPQNPYGASKLAGEQLVHAATRAWPLAAASLRYFNVGGAARPALADRGTTNLIPIVLDRIARGLPPEIYGDDYDTPDGTCVRDFVHVVDVAQAHLAVLDALGDEPGHEVLNIGTGVGTSVREIVDMMLRMAGSDLEPVVRERRVGDAASVVAVVDRVRERTGWHAAHGIEDIVRSAWEGRLGGG